MTPNTPFLSVVEALSQSGVWGIVKVVYLIAFLIYIGFAIVVVSQVKQMTRTVTGGINPQLVIISWLHLGLAVLAFIWALMVL